jgi:hypothetical protein
MQEESELCCVRKEILDAEANGKWGRITIVYDSQHLNHHERRLLRV